MDANGADIKRNRLPVLAILVIFGKMNDAYETFSVLPDDFVCCRFVQRGILL